MARFFNAPFSTDYITFSIGNGPPDQGPITMAALVRANNSNFTGWIVGGFDGSFQRWSMLTASTGTAQMYMENDFGTGGPAVNSTDWFWVVGTKASGSALPRWHVRNITTAGAWAHSNGSANVPDITGTCTGIMIGNREFTPGTGTGWRGWMAAVAAWNTALSDAAIEAACTLTAHDLLAASPNWGVLLNQASTSDTVTDFTGGGGNQNGISGTSVDAEEPPGWDYGGGATLDAAGTATQTGAATGTLIKETSVSGTATQTGAATGALTWVTTAAGTATGTGAATGALTLDGESATATAATGSWEGLLAIVREARMIAAQKREQIPSDCPEHGWPLEPGLRGELHCQFGGHLIRG